MNPPLLEVNLDLQFDPLEYSPEQLQSFARQNDKWLRRPPSPDATAIASFATADDKGLLALERQGMRLKSTQGVSFSRLRPEWIALLESVRNVFGIPGYSRISLSYFNEIPIVDLRAFRSYVNICFDMPSPLAERIEFFRTEFTCKFPFGDVHLWIQPDWDDKLENYCIQLSIEARVEQPVAGAELEGKLQQLHQGIKEVFHQTLSQDCISQLPQ